MEVYFPSLPFLPPTPGNTKWQEESLPNHYPVRDPPSKALKHPPSKAGSRKPPNGPLRRGSPFRGKAIFRGLNFQANHETLIHWDVLAICIQKILLKGIWRDNSNLIFNQQKLKGLGAKIQMVYFKTEFVFVLAKCSQKIS